MNLLAKYTKCLATCLISRYSYCKDTVHSFQNGLKIAFIGNFAETPHTVRSQQNIPVQLLKLYTVWCRSWCARSVRFSLRFYAFLQINKPLDGWEQRMWPVFSEIIWKRAVKKIKGRHWRTQDVNLIYEWNLSKSIREVFSYLLLRW